MRRGEQLVVLEAMKMQHVITSDRSGIVRRITIAVGDVIRQGHPLVFIEEADMGGAADEGTEAIDPGFIRPESRGTESPALIYI